MSAHRLVVGRRSGRVFYRIERQKSLQACRASGSGSVCLPVTARLPGCRTQVAITGIGRRVAKSG